MALTTAEETRIQKIETVLNDMQTSINNLAAKEQLQQLLVLKQKEIEDLQNRVTSLESQIQVLQSQT